MSMTSAMAAERSRPSDLQSARRSSWGAVSRCRRARRSANRRRAHAARESVRVQRGEDQIAEVRETGLAAPERLLCLGGGGRAEQVAQFQFAEPAAESFEALFLLVELGQHELALA